MLMNTKIFIFLQKSAMKCRAESTNICKGNKKYDFLHKKQ